MVSEALIQRVRDGEATKYDRHQMIEAYFLEHGGDTGQEVPVNPKLLAAHYGLTDPKIARSLGMNLSQALDSRKSRYSGRSSAFIVTDKIFLKDAVWYVLTRPPSNTHRVCHKKKV